MEERAMISRIITEGRHTLATPMHIPSVEQVQLKKHAPFGSQQMILLYLEMFLITLIREHQEESGALYSTSLLLRKNLQSRNASAKF